MVRLGASGSDLEARLVWVQLFRSPLLMVNHLLSMAQGLHLSPQTWGPPQARVQVRAG